MAKESSNITGTLITLLVLGGVGYGVYHFAFKKKPQEPVYLTVKATNQPVIQTVNAGGRLQTERTILIGAQVSGLVTEVNVDFNSVVKEGDILVRIDPTTYEQKLAQAEADLKSAQASFLLTKADLERSEAMFAAGIETSVTHANTKARFIQSQATILSREAAVKDAQLNLARTVVKAPKDGIVLARATDPGRAVNASTQVPNLLTIVPTLDTLQIDAAISESDIGNVSRGQPVRFTVDAYPGRQFNASVEQVRNYAANTGGVVTYSAMIIVDNSDRKLKSGMTANVQVVIASRDANTLVVPNTALRVRIPAELEGMVKKAGDKPATPGAPAAKQLSAEERTAIEQEVITQALEKARVAAKEKGLSDMTFIENAARGSVARGRGAGGGRGGAGAGGVNVNVNAGVGQNVSNLPRTVYKLVEVDGKKYPEAVTVRVGISDGQFTEIVDSEGHLQAGDTLISYVSIPGATPPPAAARTATPAAVPTPAVGGAGRGNVIGIGR